MKKHQIHQLIYTKLNPEDSPFDKKDFHTAFYPLDVLTSTDVLVIENNIFIPDVSGFSEKQVAYFGKINNETHLYVFDIKLLPEEKDTLGRGGIFICHVFMFPESLWQKFPSPNQLMKLMEGFTYSSRNDLLKSSYIDKQLGNMNPVELSEMDIESVEIYLPNIENSFENKMLIHLIDALKKENQDQKFVIKASEAEARFLFNKLMCYLPIEQKINLGWDTMYDSGRMMDYEKTFLSFSTKEPRGGSASSQIDVSRKKIDLAKDFVIDNKPSPFLKWIAACSTGIKEQYYIEEAFKLSNSLLNGEICDISTNWNIDGFAENNTDLVDKLFIKKSKKEFRSRLTKEFLATMTYKDKLLYFLEKIEPSAIAEYLLGIIDNSKISGKQLKEVSDTYLKQNDVLVLIEQLLENQMIDLDKFSQLSNNEKLQLNKYILKTPIQKTEWYLDLIRNDKVLLSFYINEYDNPKTIIKRFKKKLKMNEEEIRDLGFSLSVIRKVFYFRVAAFFKRIKNKKAGKKKHKSE